MYVPTTLWVYASLPLMGRVPFQLPLATQLSASWLFQASVYCLLGRTVVAPAYPLAVKVTVGGSMKGVTRTVAQRWRRAFPTTLVCLSLTCGAVWKPATAPGGRPRRSRWFHTPPLPATHVWVGYWLQNTKLCHLFKVHNGSSSDFVSRGDNRIRTDKAVKS